MSIQLSEIVEALSRREPVIMLESQSDTHPWSRRSYVAANPKAEIKAYGDQIHLIEDGKKSEFQENPWTALKAFREKHSDWLFGYLGYDLKNHIEKLTSANDDKIGAPDLYFMVPQTLVEYDRKSGEVHTIRGSLSDFAELGGGHRANPNDIEVQYFEPPISKKKYLSDIKKVQQAIADGEFYELNLSHQLRGEFLGNPFTLYQKMKGVGPVPFGAYISTKNLTVCCQSPERFLRKEGSTVFTQPIKGTAERGRNSREDYDLKKELEQSGKERAENLMIVDLVRNDLNRIAKRGSVEVKALFDIETFGTVHQMVSTVTAEAEEENPVAILKACFPMGSMTGAPKIRAMKYIEELEHYKRGIYSGAVGYIKPNDDFDFNVVIRTAIIKKGQLFYSVGGAITGDSDPHKEWQETLIKARALLDVFT